MNEQLRKVHFCDEVEVRYFVPSPKKNFAIGSPSVNHLLMRRRRSPFVLSDDEDSSPSPVKQFRSDISSSSDEDSSPTVAGSNGKLRFRRNTTLNIKKKLNFEEVSNEPKFANEDVAVVATGIENEDKKSRLSKPSFMPLRRTEKAQVFDLEIDDDDSFNRKPKRYLRSNVMKDLTAPLQVHFRNKKDYTMREVTKTLGKKEKIQFYLPESQEEIEPLSRNEDMYLGRLTDTDSEDDELNMSSIEETTELRKPTECVILEKDDKVASERIVAKKLHLSTKKPGPVMQENSLPIVQNPEENDQVVPSANDSELLFENEHNLNSEYVHREAFINGFLLSKEKSSTKGYEGNEKIRDLPKLSGGKNCSKSSLENIENFSQRHNVAKSSNDGKMPRRLNNDDKKAKILSLGDVNCFASEKKEQRLSEMRNYHHVLERQTPFGSPSANSLKLSKPLRTEKLDSDKKDIDKALAPFNDVGLTFGSKGKRSPPKFQLVSEKGMSETNSPVLRGNVAKYSKKSVKKSILKKTLPLSKDDGQKIPLHYEKKYKDSVLQSGNLKVVLEKYPSVLEKQASVGRYKNALKIPLFCEDDELILEPCFEQPRENLESLEKKVENCTVALESAETDTSDGKNYISGTVRVKKLDKVKHVQLRMTVDGWKHHEIVKCDFMMKCKSEQDVFMFDYATDAATDNVMFYVECMIVDEQRREICFIDNNDGKNFTFCKNK